jgi:predicted protein tyrosine phosphatase
MKNITVLSKRMFDNIMMKNNITNENVKDKLDVAFISINNTEDTKEIPYFNDCNSDNVLVLYFDDVEEDIEIPIIGENKIQKVKAFTIEQARILFNFIVKNTEKKSFIIHCTAGISRSGAVGTFINDYFQQSYHKFLEKNPYILPNGHVLRLLNKIFYENL